MTDSGAGASRVENTPGRASRLFTRVLTFAPALVFAWVVGHALGHRPLWRDETATLEFARLSVPDLARAVSHIDLVLAPYYLLMHASVSLFGSSATMLRLPSAAASVVTVALVAFAVRRRWGTAAGVVAGAVLASNSAFLQTATTARAYALAGMLLALAAWLGGHDSPRRGKLALTGWSVATVLAVLLQLFSVLALPGLLLGLGARRSWRTRLLVALPAAATALGLYALTASQSGQVSWIPRLGARAAWHTLLVSLSLSRVWPVATLVALGLLVQVVRRRVDATWWMWLTCTALPPLALWTASQIVAPMFVVRYAVFLLPGLAGLVGASVGLLLTPVRHVGVRALIGAALVALIALDGVSALRHTLSLRNEMDSTPTLSTALESRVAVGDTVIFTASPSAGGYLYGWSLYGHDTQMQHDLLSELPRGEGAVHAARRVVGLHPLRTVATDRVSTHVVYIAGAGLPHAPPVPGCTTRHVLHLAGTPALDLTCPAGVPVK